MKFERWKSWPLTLGAIGLACWLSEEVRDGVLVVCWMIGTGVFCRLFAERRSPHDTTIVFCPPPLPSQPAGRAWHESL